MAALVIPFPMHRVRRTHRGANVFAALHDQAELERAVVRFFWSCTLGTMFLSAVLQLSLG